LKSKFVISALFASGLVGCANTSFSVGETVSQTANPKYEERQPYFLSGIGQSQTINAAGICGGADKVSALAKERTATDIALSLVTLGIYTPQTARVYCR
jgi:Bor protein